MISICLDLSSELTCCLYDIITSPTSHIIHLINIYMGGKGKTYTFIISFMNFYDNILVDNIFHTIVGGCQAYWLRQSMPAKTEHTS